MGRSEFAEDDFGFSDTGPGDLPDALSWPQRQDDCALGRSPGKGLAMPWAVGRPGAFPYTCARRPSSRAAGPGTGAQHTGCSAAWLARLLWEQEAAGSNPAIPTKHAGRRACGRPSAWLLRSFDRHLTVELNANWRQRLSRTGPKGQGWWMRQWLVLNRFLVLTHVGTRSELGTRAVARTEPRLVIIAGTMPSAGRVVVSELGRCCP